MRHAIIIPAHNEEQTISGVLESLCNQSHLPDAIIVVNDNSTDNTPLIVTDFQTKHRYVRLINFPLKSSRDVGAKVVAVFNHGLESIDLKEYDLISKFDADLIFPKNYLETIYKMFNNDPELGLAGGICMIKQDNVWVNEGISDFDHVRGPIKTYRTTAFLQIGGFKSILGWDVVDEYLLRYMNWKVVAVPSLHVRHLRPTNAEGNWRNLAIRGGEGMYQMRYGPIIGFISSMKRGLNRKPYFISGIMTYLGYILAYFKNRETVVTKKQGVFIRKYRTYRILQKVGLFIEKK